MKKFVILNAAEGPAVVLAVALVVVLAFVVAVAFLAVIPAGNLLFQSLYP